jgi:hypothetical protein
MTNGVAQYKEHLRALFKRDPDTAQRIADSMGDGTWQGSGRMNLAVFGLAAEKRFKDDKSHEAVLKFVSDASTAWASAPNPPNALHLELLIRAVLGEPALFDEVPADVRNTIFPTAAYLMVEDLDLSDTEIDQLLDAAERKVG